MKKVKSSGYRPQPVEKSFAKWRKKPSFVAAYEALSGYASAFVYVPMSK